jgi:hypothetical protein
MGLDIRWPIGLMFTIIGVLLTLNGFLTASKPETYARSLGINVDLWWGMVLLIFGAFMLLMAKMGSKQPGANPPTRGDEGRVTVNNAPK